MISKKSQNKRANGTISDISSSSSVANNVTEVTEEGSSSSTTSTTNKNKKRRLSVKDMQIQSKAETTRAKYSSGLKRFLKWWKAKEEQYGSESSLLIADPTDVFHSMKWSDIPWEQLDGNGDVVEGAPSIAAYLFDITYNPKTESQFQRSVPETFWALYLYALQMNKLECSLLIKNEFSQYMKGYKCELAKVAESSCVDLTSGRDPMVRLVSVFFMLYTSCFYFVMCI